MRRSGVLALAVMLAVVGGCGSATLLPDGRVLLLNIVAKMYDPATGRVSNLPTPPTPRVYETATLLQDGRVLIAGGASSLEDVMGTSGGSQGTALASADLYDPATGSYTPTGSMAQPRALHTATLLADGRVLIQGGGAPTSPQQTGAPADPAVVPAPEIYDPATGTFGPAGGDTVIPLVFASATLLQDGKVLLAGGQTATLPGPGATPDPDDSNGTPTGEAELFDPATGTFSATGSMSMPRIFHTATLLPDGRVLIVGGTVDLDLGGTSDTPDPTMQTAELYDPATGTFTATGSPGMPRIGHAAALLSDGRVLITGGTAPGASGSGSLTRAAEIYDPATGTFSPTGDMVTGHVFHSATTLPDGHVLIAGLDEAAMSGLSGGTPDLLASAELYDPATGTFTTVEVEPAIMPSPAPTEG